MNARPQDPDESRSPVSAAQPQFSVVIPVYNRAGKVSDAIRSVLSQSVQSFEVLVIDDGSQDDIEAAMAGFSDRRIRLIRQPNGGASAARNLGIDLAQAPYVAFLDSDDSFTPEHLESMAALLESGGKTAACSRVWAVRENATFLRPPRSIRPGEPMATYLMCDRGFIQTSGLVVPVEAARMVRYRTDVSYGDDTDFAIRLQLAGYQFRMADEPSVIWSDGPDPRRLTNLRLDPSRLAWLDDLKRLIPPRAYHGYRGWHLARSLFRHRPAEALRLYLVALTHGSYSPKLALVILAQICLPNALYRRVSDAFLRLTAKGRQLPNASL